MRVKFLDFKNESQIDKKLKSYKKDLNDQFKTKISELKDSMLDQGKFNSLISQLITNLSLDESIDEEEKREEENNEKDKSKTELDREKLEKKFSEKKKR